LILLSSTFLSISLTTKKAFMKKHALITIALLLSAAMSFGAGFQINVQGLRQIAMAGTGAGWIWDASSIFYNPGGLARLKNIQAYGSVQFLIVNTKYVQTPTGAYSEEAKQGIYTPFNLYIGGRLKEDGKLALGLGIYTPFGSGMKWNDNWEGRYLIQNIQLSTIFFQPTISYKLADAVSIGGGFVYATGNLKMRRAIPIQDQYGNDSYGELKGKASGVGFNLGVHVMAGEKVQIGVDYRSQVNMKVKHGDATFVVPSALTTSFPNTDFTTEVPLPQVLAFGIGVRLVKSLTITAQVDWMGWKPYDTLRFDYEQHTPTLQDTRAARNYKNTLAVRLGVHYKVSDKLALMAGSGYDPTPVTDGFVSPDLPDADRYLVTGGATFKATNKLTILAAIEYGMSKKRDAQYLPDNFNGKYQTKALIPSIGVTYDFK
jgi:long-chain fatty acid transport protein